MDYYKKYAIVRITDIHNDLVKDVDDNKISKDVLTQLYHYHLNNNPYPMSNWNACRIRVLSKIAVKLNDTVSIWFCHYELLNYMLKLSHQNWINNDFLWRDSLEYVVFGYLQVVRASQYLLPITNYSYIRLFDYVLNFMTPYVSKQKTHREFIYSKVSSDINKPSYGKEFINTNPKLLSVFMNELAKLIN